LNSWLRHFLPFGLVRASQLASEFERIGRRIVARRSPAREVATQSVIA